MAHPTVQRGSKGQAVTDAQQALADRGYQLGPGGVDGLFGMHTYRAVLDYQADRAAGQPWAFSYALDIDGIVGPQTWGRLAPDRISSGSRGTGVRLAQSILKDSGVPEWDPGVVDGVFGPATELAVSNFQADMGIAKDGVVGPETWMALWS
jgi:peptidoglycan hydrolase-like protein with peptidoglycan-binding domain